MTKNEWLLNFLSGCKNLVKIPNIYLFFENIYLFLRDKRACAHDGGTEREGHRRLEADMGLQFMTCEIMIWAEVGCLKQLTLIINATLNLAYMSSPKKLG